ncbi:MAG: AmmeMemoRadiSam system protein A [Treponema sp.]|jgi:AmmeMemoRadiSam system protein A|nr:AmmeMemoRadiSam system protein A [Treponema sp.]
MEFTITQEEQGVLLADAREVIAASLEDRPPVFQREPELSQAIASGASALAMPCGAFVTLHKAGALRGCIGRMAAADPLERTVHTMALEAAFRDRRFPPLAKAEFPQCRIEISALSPLERCPDPHSVIVGVHGLYLIHKGHSGVLLPQVPLEQGWNLEEYLAYIGVKAGLSPHAYEAPGAELYTFTALVFGEDRA